MMLPEAVAMPPLVVESCAQPRGPVSKPDQTIKSWHFFLSGAIQVLATMLTWQIYALLMGKLAKSTVSLSVPTSK